MHAHVSLLYMLILCTYVGTPTLVPPTGTSTVLRGFITLTCGQDVIVPTFMEVSALFISCLVFNGTEPLTFSVIKDGVLISGSSFSQFYVSPNETSYGTYTFIVSSEKCGHASAVSRILRQGKLLIKLCSHCFNIICMQACITNI